MAAQAATQASCKSALPLVTSAMQYFDARLAWPPRHKSACLGGRLRGHDEK
jgi:hypothetical protein